MIKTIPADAKQRRQAKAPHELFTVNTVIVNLFFSVALIKLFNLSMSIAIGSAIVVSLCIIVYTFYRTKKAKLNDHYLVYLHWQLSLNRYKLLISAYVFYFLVTSLSLIIVTDAPASMDGTNIMQSILGLLGVVPLFFAVLILVVLGSGSMFNAGRGEIDETFTKKYPQ